MCVEVALQRRHVDLATGPAEIVFRTSGTSGGDPEMVETLCRAATAVGADGLFIETHPSPKAALSDAESMIELQKMEEVLNICRRLRDAIRI